MSKKLPIIAIVGRANVGKSSLFNAILERREAIVAREPGTTRDSITAKASWNGQDFWLVDTAGMKDAEDEFEFTIQEQILQAADSADVIWVVVEADVPIMEEDRKVAKLALRSRKPVFLVVNKVDKARGHNLDIFQRLGIKPIIHTSTTQHRGIGELLDTLIEQIPHATLTENDDRLRVALLGRPNVGKSALFNALAKKQQAIVADRAGTTRDINRAQVRYEGQDLEIMDTAGIRRSGKIGTGIEHFSVVRTLSAIEQADVCLLLMDVNELSVALDQKIAGLIKEAGKGLVLVVSKWDDEAIAPLQVRTAKSEAKIAAKVEEIEAEKKLSKSEKIRRSRAINYNPKDGSIERDAFTRDTLAARITGEYDFVPWAPLIFTSAITGQNVTKIFDLVLQIASNRKTRISTRALNNWLGEVTVKHPPAGLKNRAPKLNYIVQEDDNPTPAFKIFGAHTKFVHWSYRRYLEKELRHAFDFAGTALQLWFIEKHVTHKHGNSPTKADRSEVQRDIRRKKAPRT
ncbi:MAG TPA: ribosome biogenesis GTPase Der [Candidatus Saccharimonadales bacterium]|nr:ribosome biogenesis GTPase Der [Candidatus Saccharimonadales bacterium]